LDALLGHGERAHDAYDRALTLYERLGDRAGQATVLNRLGRLLENSEPDLARQYAARAVKLQLKQTPDDLGGPQVSAQ
ncbi:MAG TPA: hypothetical protein VL403_18650, partial [Candidatus Kryptonia bacterium]|nr:hypothetical protein [Candidatus Kryptonia bacterium]